MRLSVTPGQKFLQREEWNPVQLQHAVHVALSAQPRGSVFAATGGLLVSLNVVRDGKKVEVDPEWSVPSEVLGSTVEGGVGIQVRSRPGEGLRSYLGAGIGFGQGSATRRGRLPDTFVEYSHSGSGRGGYAEAGVEYVYPRVPNGRQFDIGLSLRHSWYPLRARGELQPGGTTVGITGGVSF